MYIMFFYYYYLFLIKEKRPELSNPFKPFSSCFYSFLPFPWDVCESQAYCVFISPQILTHTLSEKWIYRKDTPAAAERSSILSECSLCVSFWIVLVFFLFCWHTPLSSFLLLLPLTPHPVYLWLRKDLHVLTPGWARLVFTRGWAELDHFITLWRWCLQREWEKWHWLKRGPARKRLRYVTQC